MEDGTISNEIEWFSYLLILVAISVIVFFIVNGVKQLNDGTSQL